MLHLPMNQPEPLANQPKHETTGERAPPVGPVPEMSVEMPSQPGRLMYFGTFLVIAVSTLFLLGVTLCDALGVHLRWVWLSTAVMSAGIFGQPVPRIAVTVHWVAPAVNTALFYLQVVLVLRRLFLMFKPSAISPPTSYRVGVGKLIKFGWGSSVVFIAWGLLGMFGRVPLGYFWHVSLVPILAILYGFIWVEVWSFRKQAKS